MSAAYIQVYFRLEFIMEANLEPRSDSSKGIEKSAPRDHHLSLLGKPRNANR